MRENGGCFGCGGWCGTFGYVEEWRGIRCVVLLVMWKELEGCLDCGIVGGMKENGYPDCRLYRRMIGYQRCEVVGYEESGVDCELLVMWKNVEVSGARIAGDVEEWRTMRGDCWLSRRNGSPSGLQGAGESPFMQENATPPCSLPYPGK